MQYHDDDGATTNLAALREATDRWPNEPRRAALDFLLGWLAAETDPETWTDAVAAATEHARKVGD